MRPLPKPEHWSVDNTVSAQQIIFGRPSLGKKSQESRTPKPAQFSSERNLIGQVRSK